MINTNNIRYVIFDLYGTLVKFGVQHRPFRKALNFARETGRQLRKDDAQIIMATNVSLKEIMQALGISLSDEYLRSIDAEISEEINNLSLFDDVIETINELEKNNITVCICSNLAKPYGVVIEHLLADFDLKCFFSYEIGAIKPDREIYKSVCDRFNCDAAQCLFVGDTYETDYSGPIAFGMNALHLNRNGAVEPYQITSLREVLSYLKSKQNKQTS